MRRSLTVLLVLGCASAAAAGCGSLGAEITPEGQLTCTVGLWHNEWTVFPADWLGFALEIHPMGECAVPERLNAELIPVPSLDEPWETTLTFDLPRLPTTWVVELVGVDGNGASHWVDGCGDPTSRVHVSSGLHRLRGRLDHWNGGWILDPCTAGCWHLDGCWPPVTAGDLGVTPQQIIDWYLAGQVLELLGTYVDGGMPSYTCFEIRDYALTDEDCLPVPNETATWSELKSAYR